MSEYANLRNACQDALQVFQKIKDEKYQDIQSKLEFCIGSYDYDQNPSGLYEFGNLALNNLKDIKSASPRKVSKKVIENLEKHLS